MQLASLDFGDMARFAKWLGVYGLAFSPLRLRAQSQGEQDAILAGLFRFLGTTNRFYVEVGFNAVTHDGGSGSNTWALKEQGWRGLLLDGRFSNPRIGLHQHFVSSANIVALFGEYDVPLYPDYVSIDIDTADLWIFKALAQTYRPRVVSIEYNSQFPPESTVRYTRASFTIGYSFNRVAHVKTRLRFPIRLGWPSRLRLKGQFGKAHPVTWAAAPALFMPRRQSTTTRLHI